MKNLLFLVHRIPYPPNKGDKIRSYHFLKGLAKEYHIHLAAFIDDPDDHQHIKKVQDLTVNSLFIKLNPSLAKIKSIFGFLKNTALTLPYYHSKGMQKWVDKTMSENKIDKVFIFSSAMAQYVQQYDNLDLIVDFVDVDSDKWLQYSQRLSWPMSWVYRREAKFLLKFDYTIANQAKMNIFVSLEESALFKSLVDVDAEKISHVNNGVDIDFFNVNEQYPTPYKQDENIIVFTGAMDYWFVNKAFSQIKRINPQAVFYIVGSNPTKDVLRLAQIEGVFVTGRVHDIRPYLMYSHVVVAPLQIARGIQNKVLEAMAMGKKIVATTQAIEGISIDKQAVVIVNDEQDFAQQVVGYLNDINNPQFCVENRDFVTRGYSWDASLKRLVNMIESA